MTNLATTDYDHSQTSLLECSSPELEAQDRVSKGAAALDATWTGGPAKNWRSAIDLQMFDVDDVYYCVLGQLYESYYRAPAELLNRAVALGFDDLVSAIPYLQAAWIKELTR